MFFPLQTLFLCIPSCIIHVYTIPLPLNASVKVSLSFFICRESPTAPPLVQGFPGADVITQVRGGCWGPGPDAGGGGAKGCWPVRVCGSQSSRRGTADHGTPCYQWGFDAVLIVQVSPCVKTPARPFVVPIPDARVDKCIYSSSLLLSLKLLQLIPLLSEFIVQVLKSVFIPPPLSSQVIAPADLFAVQISNARVNKYLILSWLCCPNFLCKGQPALLFFHHFAIQIPNARVDESIHFSSSFLPI